MGPENASSTQFNPAVAVSAVLPTLTMLADDAEAKYTDYRRWSSVLVPLTTLVFPTFCMGAFVLYAAREDAFWQFRPGCKRMREYRKSFKEHPLFADIDDPLHGLVYPEDYEKGLEEAWEQAKPKGSSVTVQDKLKQLSTQNNPHWLGNRPGTAA